MTLGDSVKVTLVDFDNLLPSDIVHDKLVDSVKVTLVDCDHLLPSEM